MIGMLAARMDCVAGATAEATNAASAAARMRLDTAAILTGRADAAPPAT
jgi:hypothetical protein